MKLEPKQKQPIKTVSVQKQLKKQVKSKGKKESTKFGIRFMGWLASNVGIPGYSNMSLSTLQLKIGLYFIKQSGVVQSNLFDDLKL